MIAYSTAIRPPGQGRRRTRIHRDRPRIKEAIDGFKLQTGEDIEQGAKVSALFVDPSIHGQTRFAVGGAEADVG